MKKQYQLTLLFLSLILLTSCHFTVTVTPRTGETDIITEIETEIETEAENEAAAAPISAENFLPLRANVLYEYKGEGNEFASYTMTFDYISVNMVQQRISNGGTEIVRVFRAGEGKISELMSKGDIYYSENFLGSAFDPNEEKIILKDPIEPGTAWTLADGSVKTITNTAFILPTPSGTYEAVEVTTENAQGEMIGLDYFAEVGLVKTVFNPGADQVISILSDIRENTPAEQQVSLFYPNADDDVLHYTDESVFFPTNSDTGSVLEDAYKKFSPVKVLSDNTKINSLKLGPDNIVRLDLSKAFVTEMSAGAMYESLILQSIANTFCRYYNAEELSLTIDGGTYESGHLLLKAGDLLTADYSNSLPAE